MRDVLILTSDEVCVFSVCFARTCRYNAFFGFDNGSAVIKMYFIDIPNNEKH